MYLLNVGIHVCRVPSAVLFESAIRSISTLAIEIPGCHFESSGSHTFMNLIHELWNGSSKTPIKLPLINDSADLWGMISYVNVLVQI